VLLKLFLIDLAAGFYLFLPLVGRRNAGVKFYRLILIISGALSLCAARNVVDLVPAGLTVIVYAVLRYPKRMIYRVPAVLLAGAHLVAAVLVWQAAMRPSHLAWSIAGALASVALLGSVNLAMMLGHWYLVVHGMPIDPLRRLTIATLVASLLRLAVVIGAIVIGGVWHEVAIRQGIFFWMRVGWGLVGPLALYPLVWGTVKLRSTMAATGILYVDVVAVIIGEILGGWLSAMSHLPV
jgi:hypothetical protein